MNKKVLNVRKILENSYNPEYDLGQLDQMQDRIRQNLPIAKLGKTKGVKELVKMLDLMVESCDNSLKTNRKLTDIERSSVFTQRDCWQWLTSYFRSAEEAVMKEEQNIDDIIKENKDGI